MRTFNRTIKIISVITLFFFCWTFLPIYAAVAYAAEKPRVSNMEQADRVGVKDGNTVASVQKSGERFEKALEAIRENVSQADDKAGRGDAATGEIEAIKKHRAEIESADIEFKKEFAATEKKLKDAKLPKEILDRHAKFVKHYEDNLKELKTNLDDVEQAKTTSDRKARFEKARLHLEKVKAPSKHQKLDPNNLPFRARTAGKKVEPRLKKEDFERDFPKQKKIKNLATDEHDWTRIVNSAFRNPKSALNHRPILLAFNEFASDVPFQLPRPVAVKASPELACGEPVEPVERGWGEGARPQLAFADSAPFLLAQAATTDTPTTADLAETPEITFSPELRQIATLLENNPVQLYEFVRNNFTYDPYYGSVKGSQGTLLLQNGNDIDQASVLIALFRVSGIPARYAYGTVEIPIEKVMKWLGGITDPRTAGTVLATNGIPAKLIISGGAIKSVQIEHTWIEAYIPYANYRGLINDPTAAKTWIPLDPSFKFIEPNSEAIDLADSQQFDIDSYLTSYLQTVKSTTPAKEYLKNSIYYVTANIPGKRFYDLLVSNNISDKVLGLLPDTLPYPVKSVGAKFSAIPDTYRHRIALEFAAPNTNETVLNYSASWTSILHNRFTISYTPATAADEQIIASYGDIYSTPSYLIQVKPVLKVEGITVAEGTAVPMASDLMFRMSFILPDGTIDKAVTNSLVAGAPYAIGLGSGYTTGRIVTNRTAKLEAAVNAGQFGEPIIGEYLNLFAVNYLQELDSSRKLIAKSMKTLDTNRSTELMVGVDLGVSAIFGMPRAVDIRGVLIDVDYNVATPINMDGDQAKVRRFQILAGMTSSALEHSMFESIIGVEAVSTIKALEIANVQGIPVHQIDAGNIAAKLSILQLSSEVKTEIQNAVNAGKVIIVSERNIQLNSWNGVGYIVMDPLTGAGAYLISGGMSGGSLTYNIINLKDQIAKEQITVDAAKSYIRAHEDSIWFREPIIGTYIVSRFRTPTRPNHKGVDFEADIGSPVHVVADGTAIKVGHSQSYGYVIYVDHGLGVETRYAHNSTLKIEEGTKVSAGQIIAESGNTGHVDPMPTVEDPEQGQHLHFEILLDGIQVNPELFKIEPRGW